MLTRRLSACLRATVVLLAWSVDQAAAQENPYLFPEVYAVMAAPFAAHINLIKSERHNADFDSAGRPNYWDFKIHAEVVEIFRGKAGRFIDFLDTREPPFEGWPPGPYLVSLSMDRNGVCYRRMYRDILEPMTDALFQKAHEVARAHKPSRVSRVTCGVMAVDK